jgi:hypothetical protein
MRQPALRRPLVLVVALSSAGIGAAAAQNAPATAPVNAPVNAIARENQQPGTTDWLVRRVEPAAANTREDRYTRQRAIEGYVSRTSVRAGETLTAFVSTSPAASYRADVYRLGYYGGAGGRLMARLGPFQGSVQPEPVEGTQQLVEARWATSFDIPIGRDWVSGVYVAKLTTVDRGLESYLVWVVRDDRRADLMFQVSDITWQAYNRWPAWRSLYDWKAERWHTTPGARVSFDRPYGFYYNLLPETFVPHAGGAGEFLLWEFPLAYWLEANGYDVTYASNLDTHADADGLLRVKGFLSVGHDEYWSRRMFDNVARARDQGVSLAFLSGNAVDGEIVIAPSTDGRADRIFERFPGRGDDDDMTDEDTLMGSTSYGVGLGDWIVTRPEHWLFAGTGMKPGDRVAGLVGWEHHGPPYRDDPSLEVVAAGPVFDSRGNRQPDTHGAVVYTGPKGNVVFNAGTCWWNMVLSTPPGFTNPPNKDFARPDPRVQQITRNLLARMIDGPSTVPGGTAAKTGTAATATMAAAPTLAGHPVRLDAQGKLESWIAPQANAYDTLLDRAWNQLLTGFGVEANGLPTYLAYCCFDAKTLKGTAWPHNPAAVHAGLARGAAQYYAYSGDPRVVDFLVRALDHHLVNGTTPADPAWAWPSVPYASADHGATRYRGAHDFLYTGTDDPPRLGRGDGYGVIEPDKVAELGVGYLIAFQLTGDARYRDAALACARALAMHVRPGDATRSPWPFRVVAETGVVREEYCANVAAALELFDTLERLQLGDVSTWTRARAMVWDWTLKYPLQNDRWANYFEDVFTIRNTSNVTQYNAGELARYLLEHPERDIEWRAHAGRLLAWIETTFGGDTARERGVQWGAIAISEQAEYTYKMGSHTARFAAAQALWAERTGDDAAREKAFRAFNWASYMSDARGVVRVGPVEDSLWFSDGYADYLRHFQVGLGAVPAWAPPGEDHLLRSSSVVTTIAYTPGDVRYRAFDAIGDDVLCLRAAPRAITVDGAAIPSGPGRPGVSSWTFDASAGVLRVHRAGGREVVVR